MKHQDIIPIIKYDWENQNLLYYYTAMITGLNWIDAVFSAITGSVVYFDWKEETRAIKKETIALLNITPKTYNNTEIVKRDAVRTDDFVVLMPIEVWKELLARLEKVPTKRKKTIVRVFIYLYWNCSGYGFYFHSRDAMVEELKMQKMHLSESLKWLEDNGFIVRSKSFWSESTSRATSYAIPEIKADKDWAEIKNFLQK